jgi:hypothetical protein
MAVWLRVPAKLMAIPGHADQRSGLTAITLPG